MLQELSWCGGDLVTPLLSVRPEQQLRQLGEVRHYRRASSRVSRFGPRVVRRSEMSGWARSGSARHALETTLMTQTGSRTVHLRTDDFELTFQDQAPENCCFANKVLN
jgi:hypothetical protein